MGKKKLNKAQIGTALKPITAENVSDFFSLFSIPQKAITKLITGKYQAPSEAMGIKNKAGAIATDMVLDPVNLVGAGAVKATGAYKNAYKLNPFAEKLVNPKKSYRVTGRDAFDDFVESGMVRSYTPMPKSGMSFAEKLAQRPTGFPSFQKGYADLGYLPEKGGVVFETGLPTYKRGELNPVTGSAIKGRHYAHRVIDPQTGSVMSNVPGKDIKVYEGVPNWLMGHKEIKVPKKKQNGGWLDKYDAPKAQNGIEGTMGGLTDQGFNYNGAWGGTMQRGGNIQPPMAGAIQTVPMYQMGGNLPGSVGFMYARTGAPSKGPRRNQTDVTDASAQNGAEMKYYQEGLDWKPKNISQDGIKVDPMGYWNPDNVGEPVIIPSNEITMEGVYEPLIGISDTGDVQYMEPGEEYEFDGESVTEYPIAQSGKKIKIPMSDFKKMGNSYLDSVNTYDYTQALWDAVRTRNSSAVDQSISRNKNLINNTSDVKPTSYDNVTVGGKNYRIPSYKYPEMDPWEKYEPVSGFWDNVGSKLSDINNAIGKTNIGKSLQNVNDKLESGVKKIWNKFTDDYVKNNVKNQGALSTVNKQSVPLKTPPTAPPVVSKSKPKPKPKPIDKPNPKPISKSTVESKKEQPVKKTEQPKPVERKQNIYEGSPVYSPGTGSGLPSALIGFANQKGDTTYIKPEDYERFAVPKYGKEFIESRKKQRNGGVNSADAQPIKKLDQLLNFTNYNKPTKGGWLDRYEN